MDNFLDSVVSSLRASELPAESELLQRWGCLGEGFSPLVSVQCATYNHVCYVEDCLRGVLFQQTDFPFEIIVLDDASNDGTSELLQKWADAYPTLIRYIRHDENQLSQGLPPSYFAHGKHRGTYIAHCDGDDFWRDKTKLVKQVSVLEGNPHVVLVGHGTYLVDQGGSLLREEGLSVSFQRDCSGEDLVLSQGFYLPSTIMYKNVLKEYDYERGRVINGDIFLLSLLGQHGSGIWLQDVEPNVYRVHDGALWSTLSEDRKHEQHMQTFYWLYRYYVRKGRQGYAAHFRNKYQRTALKAVNGSLLMQQLFRVLKQKLRDKAFLRWLAVRLRRMGVL